MKSVQYILVMFSCCLFGLHAFGQSGLDYEYKGGYLILPVPDGEEGIRAWEDFTGILSSQYDSLKTLHSGKTFTSFGWTFYNKNGNTYSKKKLKELDFNRLLKFNICDENIPVDKTKKYERFGVNYFVEGTAPTYQEGLCTFTLPGHENAKKVFLAGSFNQWSTTQDKMRRTDSGWSLTLPLEADKYEYKYIVDGKWMLDPNNRRAEGDGYGNTNSVLFLPNHKFVLEGNTNAKVVSVIGNFNDWNLPGVPLNRVDGGWELEMLLHDGAIEYQYVVDGQRQPDPNSAVNTKERNGMVFSTFNNGPVCEFEINTFTDATDVRITGVFTDWSTTGIPMFLSDQNWKAVIPVEQGNYEYKLIVDGYWSVDPTNPHTTGDPPMENSVMSIDPNHSFYLKGNHKAEEVIVTGTFNNWQESGYRMKKTADGWTMDLYLPKGKTRYKFIVDGEWIADPDNPLWERNQYDSKDSILWIE